MDDLIAGLRARIESDCIASHRERRRLAGIAQSAKPALVIPHGDPTGQRADFWSPEVQALAWRGYICIAPIAFQINNSTILPFINLPVNVFITLPWTWMGAPAPLGPDVNPNAISYAGNRGLVR